MQSHVMMPLAHFGPPALAGRSQFKSYAAWPVWSGSVREEIRFQPMPKREAVRLWHKARDFDRRTHQPGRHGGTIGHSALQVLHALVFDFLNYTSGRLDPSYAAIARKANVCERTVATALGKLKALGCQIASNCDPHFASNFDPLAEFGWAEASCGDGMGELSSSGCALRHPGSIPTEPSWWVESLEFGEVEFADGLQRLGCRAVLQTGRQRRQPGGILILQHAQLGDSVTPSLGPAAMVGQTALVDDWHASCTSGAAACLAFSIGHRSVADRLARHGSTPKRDVTKPRPSRAAQLRVLKRQLVLPVSMISQ